MSTQGTATLARKMADYRLGLADRAGVSRINDMATIEIANLSPEERLQLLDALWESLSATPEAIPLTSAQREELDRRLDELDREGPTGIPWDEVLRRIGCKSR